MDDHDDRKALFSSLTHHFSNTRLSVSSEISLDLMDGLERFIWPWPGQRSAPQLTVLVITGNWVYGKSWSLGGNSTNCSIHHQHHRHHHYYLHDDSSPLLSWSPLVVCTSPHLIVSWLTQSQWTRKGYCSVDWKQCRDIFRWGRDWVMSETKSASTLIDKMSYQARTLFY